MRRTFLGAALIALSGCAVFRPTVIPMAQVVDLLPREKSGQGPRHLVVFLPGAYDEPTDFIRYGFVQELRRRNMAADVIAVDSHYGYFSDYSIAERVRDDVIAPARAKGYEQIWLVGISLGGLGSLLTVERYPGITGIIALAPYVASSEAIAEVRRAGGLRVWQAQTSTVANGWEKRLLNWFARYDPTLAGTPRLVIGYGLQDRFADNLAEITRVLRPDRVLTLQGGHDWPTWKALWNRSLDLFAAEVAPGLQT